MPGCEIAAHKGKTIVIVDLSNTKGEDAIPILRDAQKVIAQLPPKSGLVLTDATNAVYNNASQEAVKAFASKNTPYVRASAVVGADGLRAFLLQVVARLTGREIKPCKTRVEAMDWLASHA